MSFLVKKKIVVFNLSTRGGMLHYSSQFCNELNKNKNIALKVIVADYGNLSLYNKKTNFIKIRTNPTIGNFMLDTLLIHNHIKIIYKIIKFKPNIIHFIDNHPRYIIYSLLFKLLGYQIYTTQHDPILHSGDATTFLGKIAHITNRVLRTLSNKLAVHGDKIKKEIIQNYKINANKIISIKHGNYNFLKDSFSKGGEKNKNSFLFFGRIVDYKGLDVLLKSLSIVKKDVPDFKLIIAGSGDINKYKKQLVKYKSNIDIYNKYIKDEEIYKYFEMSEFVVLPYKDATGSGIIPVAYAFSLPVIISNVGELSTVVGRNITGLILKDLDYIELGNKIISLLKNKKKSISMGQKGRLFSDKILGRDKIVDKIYF